MRRLPAPMRRLPALAAALLAAVLLALALASCGDDQPSGGLDEALAYLPKDASVVVAIETDPDGGQIRQVETHLDRFAFSGQLKEQLKQGLSQGFGDYESVRPLFGNDLVLGFLPKKDGQRQFVTAVKTDGEKAKEVAARQGTPAGDIDGAPVFAANPQGGSLIAVDGDVLLNAPTRELLQQAIERRDGGDHLDAETFEARLGDLPKDALVRVSGDFERILGQSPGSERARSVKWLGALRTFGATIRAEEDGIAAEGVVQTEGELSDDDLPIAGGPQSPRVVKRGSEVGVGMRDLTRTIRFVEQVLQATDRRRFDEYARTKERFRSEVGVDVDRDVFDQLHGDTSISFALDGSNATRTALRDPRAFDATLAKLADGFPKIRRIGGTNVDRLEKPKEPGGLYTATGDGKTTYYGVVNGVFVTVTGGDEERAREIAAQSPSQVEGAQGAVVLSADSQAIANEIIGQRLEGAQSLAARAFTGPLGDVTGWLRAGPDELRGKLKLKIE